MQLRFENYIISFYKTHCMESNPLEQQSHLTEAELQALLATNGKDIECKAAVAWEAKKPLDVCDVIVSPP